MRSPRPLVLAAAALVLVPGAAAATPSADPSAPPDEQPRYGVPVGSQETGEGLVEELSGVVDDLDGAVLDIIGRVASEDGALTDVGDGDSFVLAADVYFAFDSAALQPRAAVDLASVAEKVKASGASALTVTGHTDSVGTPAYNQSLSQQRAESVKAALTPLLPGVSITAEGKGETEPAAAESGEGVDVPAAQAANRRVEITVGQ